ncbi:hypothetical protein LTS18_007271, partial [Coniosporium uncinatum]
MATRLAQCLNPTLPSGVHQKALEVYAHIFAIIDRHTFARDLHIYFPGLSPVLSFASLSVRPAFLSLVGTHICGLDSSSLRPALKALILCILPGLEEETSEDFEHVLAVMDKVRIAVRGVHASGEDDESKDSFFWQCFFLATITNSSRRQGALSYLVRRLPKFGVISDRKTSVPSELGMSGRILSPAAQAAISPEPGLLVRCFAAGLMDKQLLVQRGFLDLLVTHIPLDSPVLQTSVQEDDLQRLVAAAANVVSRRDMSLNRRLWAWFLGPEPKAGEEDDDPRSPTSDPSSYQANYFAQYGLQALTKSILKIFTRSSNITAERARPFRICLSLMDRWEVGGLIVPEIFIPSLQNIWDYSKVASKENTDEVVRSASNFFDGVESSLIWSKLFDLVASALSTDSLVDDDVRMQQLELCYFIITRFNIREEEMVLHHVPLVALALLTLLRKWRASETLDQLPANVFEVAFKLADALVQLISKRTFEDAGSNNPDQNDTMLETESSRDIVKAIEAHYRNQQSVSDASDSLFTPRKLGEHTMK